ncbi:MAG TPA: AIR synthase-related protein [Planctomycetota bacterium]|nr:AIR synthase-related protein [Planctomycetota bacterium]HRR81580.1 AIR synthase-related protein [Planctomycetota bacterium]HRT94867.1 AIR synthase-related protein [Planctomycetota bacterium]
MVHRIEVGYRHGVRDAHGEGVAESIRTFLGLPVETVQTRTVYKVHADLTPAEVEAVRREFTDPVIERSAVGRLDAPPFHWMLTVGYKPGVTDNVGRTSKTAIEDILGRRLPDADAVYTERQFLLTGAELGRDDVRRIGTGLLANELIETITVQSLEEWRAAEPDLSIPVVEGEQRPTVREYNLRVSDAELMRISSEGILSCSLEEMHAIRDYFADPARQAERRRYGLGPNPTDAELEMIAQTWSEHCKHKIFNAEIEYVEDGQVSRIDSLFKSYIRRATEDLRDQCPWLLSVFHDNAGVIAFNDQWSLAYKVETHNSPSALDPYGGAITGIVGVNRDPFGTGKGAQLQINVWGYCLGSPFFEGELPEGLLHPRRIRDGVHKGVIDGGNQSGIPYARGWEIFDERYLGKPLVYCGTVGILPRTLHGQPSEHKKANPGDLIVMAGGRIGKDGIHGATFSSEELRKESPAQAVQIGDPITQKKMTDFLLEARDLGLYTCITDNGAGGLSSSIGEMSTSAGGAELDLAAAPLKYQGLDPWEILLSEAQERMSLAVPPPHIAAFLDLARRREVEATVLGRFTDSGKFHVRYGDRTVALVDLEFLHSGLPKMRLKAVWTPPRPPEPHLASAPPVAVALPDLLAELNLCSLEKKSRQYDHEVKGLTVVKPFVGLYNDAPSDASVFLADYDGVEGIVLTEGINPHYSDVDTYHMVGAIMDLALRRAVATGARLDHMAGLDNFCWPDPVQSAKTPDGHYKLAQLVRANRALYDYATAFGVPLISGKDSMKNDSTRGGVKISIPPTLLFSVIAKMDDVRKAVTMDAKCAGDLVYAVGETKAELGGSEYARYLGRLDGHPERIGASVPRVCASVAKATLAAMAQAIEKGLVHSAHAPGKGGLGVGLAKVAFAGELGMAIDLRRVPALRVDRDDVLLFSESSSRFLVTVAPADRAAFEETLGGLPCACIGETTDEPHLRLVGLDGAPVLDASVIDLKARWKATFEGI